MESSKNIVAWLDEVCPDRAPLTQLSEWEYGVLAGQRLIVEQLKIKLKIEEEQYDITK